MAFGYLGDPATITVVVVVFLAVIGIVVFAMQRRNRKPEKPPAKKQADADVGALPTKLSKSVQSTDASKAKDELRILDLEREILSDALRRLYEAHAEGKISEQERERLASSYKARMNTVKEAMAKDESIVALHELEGMQEDLMKLFSERFGELTSKVDELRSRIDVKPIREIKVQMPTPLTTVQEDMEKTDEEEEEQEAGGEDKTERKKKPPRERPATQKTEAEKRIDEIRSEVEKVLDKLGNMEIET
jgi:hypothetical protein